MKTTVRFRGSSLPERITPDATAEDIVAINMEAKFLDGWMAYTVQSKHDHVRFRKGETVLVKFGKNSIHQLFVTVKYLRQRWEGDQLVDRYELTYPKTNYWFWPGLEDEEYARRTRQFRMKGRSEKRLLRPY